MSMAPLPRPRKFSSLAASFTPQSAPCVPTDRSRHQQNGYSCAPYATPREVPFPGGYREPGPGGLNHPGFNEYSPNYPTRYLHPMNPQELWRPVEANAFTNSAPNASPPDTPSSHASDSPKSTGSSDTSHPSCPTPSYTPLTQSMQAMQLKSHRTVWVEGVM
ncbi:hypothetical protein BJ138DRAFT_1234438, partial [Hygrophoropsis aurantiaca]